MTATKNGALLGAVIGDMAGSRFEFHNHRSKDFELLSDACFFTDDTVMTLAVADAVMRAKSAPQGFADENGLSDLTAASMRTIGRHYPHCGYGGRFGAWMFAEHPLPYGSYGNGAAMRVSAAGLAADTLAEAKALARAVTVVTHGHPEGLKGAQATAVAIYMAREGATTGDIRREMEDRYYRLDFTIDGIRPTYAFNETCQNTVPQALVAFLESRSFEDAIRIAVSVGGDSDTLAAITGSIAAAYYGVPDDLRKMALARLDGRLREIYDRWAAFVSADGDT